MKTIVIGGASGIGLATVYQLAKNNHDIGVIDRNADALKQLLNDCEDQGFTVSVASADVCNPDQVAEAFQVLDPERELTKLVNCAGIGKEVPFLDTSLDLFKKIVDVNLTGTFICSQLAAKRMAANGGGVIINIASVSGLRANRERSAYGASKAGVIMLSQIMANELASENIRVNIVAPGPITTHLTDTMHSDETRQQWNDQVPMHRYGNTEDIAAGIEFLLSENAQYVTGAVLPIDGGFYSSGIVRPAN